MTAPTAAPMPPPPADGGIAAPKRSAAGKKFIFFVALAFVLHVALVFIFGTKKRIEPRPATEVATNIPHLRLVTNTERLVALGDPTLFARPNARDLVSAFWRRPPLIPTANAGWSARPFFLPPASDALGAAFREFMLSSQPAPYRPNLKPEPKLSEPANVPDEPMPQATAMQIAGELAGRRRLNAPEPPSLAMNSIVAPSRVRVLVDTSGSVASAVLLPLDSPMEEAARSDKADAAALDFVRSLRFAPAPRLTFGEIVFRWHTVPTVSTNAP